MSQLSPRKIDEELDAYVVEHVDQAMAEGWIRPYYQAVVRAATSELCAEEALARWFDPTYGMLKADQFMSALAKADVLHKVDLYILDYIIRDLKKKRDLNVPIVPVSVNLSHHDLVWFNVAEVVSEKMDALQLPHYLLTIEFTEQVAPEAPEIVNEQIRRLHEAGFTVWMDDFGSGYSTLILLQQFSFDAIKLDIDFMINVELDSRTREIISGLVRIAQRLGVATLAEGVETEEQALFFESIGCNMMQGSFFSNPLPLETVIERFEQGIGRKREIIAENSYWNDIAALSLVDPTSNLDGLGFNGKPAQQSPASVMEHRNGEWRIIRSNKTYERFISGTGLLPEGYSPMLANTVARKIDDDFLKAADKSKESGVWEMVQGRREIGSDFNFFLRKATETKDAEAFLVGSQPTMLGSSLGVYGDLPIAYALFHVILNEARDEVVDAVFIYANEGYGKNLGIDHQSLVGTSLSKISRDLGKLWFPYFYRALVHGEHVHEVVYGEEIDHWVSFDLAPSPISECCSFAFSIVDDERRELDRLEWMGNHDPLTGLLNRRGIDLATEKQVKNHPEDPFALALLDIDDFKIINDVYGHAVGDSALCSLAEAVRSFFPDRSIVGRNGGDEIFIMLCGETTNRADELFAGFAESFNSFEHDGVSYPLTVSIGYAVYPQEAEDLTAAYARADEALYAVKLAGKSGSMRYTSAMKAQYRSQLGFTPRDIAEFLPGGIMVHRAGDDGEILFVNEGLLKLFECENLDEFMELTGGSFCGVVHPDDAIRVYEELVEQVSLDDIGEKGYCIFRIVTKSGDPCYVESNGRLVDVDGIGKVFYVLMLERSASELA